MTPETIAKKYEEELKDRFGQLLWRYNHLETGEVVNNDDFIADLFSAVEIMNEWKTSEQGRKHDVQ